MNSQSRHPYNQKLSKFNSLIHRLLIILLTKKNYNKELKYIRQLAIENGFDKQIIQKLIRKLEDKQEKSTALQKIETEKSNKWLSSHVRSTKQREFPSYSK